jgi:dTDP-4-amino-4,6-dideoxygalactose transaminase
LAKLAINGGPAEAPRLEAMVLPWPRGGEKERQALIEVLESHHWCRGSADKNWVSKVAQLENEFAKFQDAKHGVAMANGTVALDIALRSLRIGFGVEVIAPAHSYIATASCANLVGAVPVLVDCDPETGTINPGSIEPAITERTKAIIITDYHGYPPDFDAILPIARKNNLFVLEDAATAVGTEWRGTRVGALGDIGTFSFQEGKLFTSGDGGMVVGNKDEYMKNVVDWHSIGRVPPNPSNDFQFISSNYRMTEFQGAVLLSMLRGDLPSQLEAKHRGGEYLSGKLQKVDGIKPPKRDPRVKYSYYKFIMRYDPEAFGGVPKGKFISALKAEGVPIDSNMAQLIYRQSAFRKDRLDMIMPPGTKMPDYPSMYLPNSEALVKEEVMLRHNLMETGEEGLDMVVAAIEKIKANVDELRVAPSISG